VPLLRYFVVVAGVLLAMLAAVNWCVPSPPPAASHEASVDKSTLHISSDHKWPQKIEFDTAMQPFIALSAPVVAAPAPAVARADPPLDALAVKSAELQVAKPKPRVRMARRAPRPAPRIVSAANQAWPQWSSADESRASGSRGMAPDAFWGQSSFGKPDRQKAVSWSLGHPGDW
jgi:hypothetical protein